MYIYDEITDVHKGIDEMCEGTRSHQPLHVTATVNKLGEWME
jgi:hypothetical protein